MPNQNNPNDPNSPTNPTDSSVSPVFAPSADLPPLPPDFQSAGTPAPAQPAQPTTPTDTTSVLTPSGTTTTTQSVTDSVEKDEEEVVVAGSAAPPELPPVVSSSPKKKFGGGRIIATILGILMLVGGVAGGVILTQQQQLFEQKADFSQSCYDDCREDKGHKVCLCRCGGECYRPDSQTAPPGSSTGSGCGSNSTSQACNNACHSDGTSACKWLNGECKVGAGGCGNTGGGEEQINPGNCPNPIPSGWVQCGSGTGGPNCTFCLKVAQRTCNQVLADRGCGTGVGGCGAIEGPVNIYYCPGSQNTSLGCQQNLNNPPANMSGAQWNPGDHNISGRFCGTVQVDDISSGEFCSRTDTSGCNQPTTPPTITASCTNVKAYNTSWTQLTAAQLSALPRGTAINFCVVGSATGGSFDRARFTINGALQAETTTKRPNSQDYCQSYTIPATGNSFNVQAQIHHTTLGWK